MVIPGIGTTGGSKALRQIMLLLDIVVCYKNSYPFFRILTNVVFIILLR